MTEIKLEQLSPKSQRSKFGLKVVAETNALVNKIPGAPVAALEAHARDRVAFELSANRIRKENAIDPLTGLLSRREILRAIDRELEMAKRKENPMQILFADVRNFKGINDQFGHQQGDYALILIAQTIKKCVRGYDLAGRYGGDEDVIIFSDGDPRAATSLGAKFHQLIGQEKLPYSTIHLDMGVVIYDPHKDGPMDSNGLIHRADQAMYYAKTHKLDYVVEWNPSMNGIVLPEDKK